MAKTYEDGEAARHYANPDNRSVEGKRAHRRVRKPSPKLIGTKVGEGVDSLADMRSEVDDMMDVLMGRKQPPIDAGLLTLQEVAFAYFARASEMFLNITRAEQSGAVIKGSALQKFRTMELRQFLEVSRAAMELGSRRVTYARLEAEQV